VVHREVARPAFLDRRQGAFGARSAERRRRAGRGGPAAKTGEAIAQRTGLGQSFARFVLLAVAISLPEISTRFAAVRMRRYLMAVCETFGANLFTIGLVFLADATYRDGPILNQADAFIAFAAVLGIAVTALFLIGLVERRDRTVGRMGIDSLAVLCTYFAGLAALYQLR
jgi:cation:H+ antiporter